MYHQVHFGLEWGRSCCSQVQEANNATGQLLAGLGWQTPIVIGRDIQELLQRQTNTYQGWPVGQRFAVPGHHV